MRVRPVLICDRWHPFRTELLMNHERAIRQQWLESRGLEDTVDFEWDHGGTWKYSMLWIRDSQTAMLYRLKF